MKFLVWQGKKSRGSFIVKQCTSLQCTVQGWTKKGTLGCVNPASRLPLAAGGEVTQPRARFFAQPCTYRTETRRRPSYCLSVKNEAFEKIGEPFLCRPKLDMSQKKESCICRDWEGRRTMGRGALLPFGFSPTDS